MKLKLVVLILCVVYIRGYPQTPPDPRNVAAMARYIIHNTGWTSLATISTLQTFNGYPFVTLKSISDGPSDNGTGIPYLYMTDLDLSGKDIKINNNVTIMSSLTETDYCKSSSLDPQDPRCAKVIITGQLVRVPKKSSEYEFGRESLFEKHPSMRYWPIGHGFYVAKIDIQQVIVLDHFGGAEVVALEKYFHPHTWLPPFSEEILVISLNRL